MRKANLLILWYSSFSAKLISRGSNVSRSISIDLQLIIVSELISNVSELRIRKWWKITKRLYSYE